MKIIDSNTLLDQKHGVIFAEYNSPNVGKLQVFGGVYGMGSTDFVSAEFGAGFPHLPAGKNDWLAFWMDSMEKGAEALIDVECYGRSGSTEQQFVLLDKEDVLALLSRITKSLTEAYGVEGMVVAPVPKAFPPPCKEFKNGMSVKELKELVKDWPEVNRDGDPTEVWIDDGRGLTNIVMDFSPLNLRILDEDESVLTADILIGARRPSE